MAKKLVIDGPNIKPHQHTVYHDIEGLDHRLNYGESVDVELAMNSGDLVKRGIATIHGGGPQKASRRKGGSH